jgi:hypothetical protein
MSFSAPLPRPALEPNDPLKAGRPRSRLLTLGHGRWEVYCVHMVPTDHHAAEWWIANDLKRTKPNGEPALVAIANSWEGILKRL